MKVLSNGRVRRTTMEWEELLSRYEQSGLSARAFCVREGVSLASLHRWRKRLGGRRGSFVELAPRPEERGSSWNLEIRLPNGVELMFRG